jgi:Sulfotransferase family
MSTPRESSSINSANALRVPDFFIVGAPKTGTTSLHRTLRTHPQIYMPALKEPRYLADDMRPRPEHAQEARELGYPDTLEDYLALFADATPEQRAGEASAFYLWSQTAAAGIAELQPAARIIATLREPASFLRSLHLMFLWWGVETETDLGKAIALEPARREGKSVPRQSHRPQLLSYSEHVRFVEQLRRYDARFAPEQKLILIYDDFQRENERTVREVLRFIGADEQLPIDVKNVNVTKRTVRSHRARRLMYVLSNGRGPVARSTKATVRALSTPRLRRGATRMLLRRAARSEPPAADDAVMRELRRRFKPQVTALSEYLDRDLVSLWGYDEVD